MYAGLVLIFAYCLAPFYWMIVSSLRRTADIFDNTLLPAPFSLENYVKVFDGSTMFGQALLNSLIVAGTTTVFALVLGVFAAYAISRLDFRFKSVILGVIITTSMFPGISVVVPLLRLFTDLGWINTYQAMIIPNLSFAIPLAVWNLTTFMKTAAVRPGGSGDDRRLHKVAGVPEGAAPAGRAGRVHHRHPDVHPQLERVHHRPLDDQRPRKSRPPPWQSPSSPAPPSSRHRSASRWPPA